MARTSFDLVKQAFFCLGAFGADFSALQSIGSAVDLYPTQDIFSCLCKEFADLALSVK